MYALNIMFSKSPRDFHKGRGLIHHLNKKIITSEQGHLLYLFQRNILFDHLTILLLDDSQK